MIGGLGPQRELPPHFGESTFLLTSIELPIVSRVCVATVEKPYLAFFLKLDMGIVRDVLHTEEVRISAPPVGTRGMVLGEVTVELLTPCSRMVQLLDTPQDVPFFCKLLQREIIYRLLQGPRVPLIIQLHDDVRGGVVIALAAAAGRGGRLDFPQKRALSRANGFQAAGTRNSSVECEAGAGFTSRLDPYLHGFDCRG